MPHFHALWRREKTKKGKNYIILDAEGKGHYIGCVLSMQGKSSFITSLAGLNPFVFYFLEGDEMIYVDGESHPPAIHGTGTEDYFNGGFYFNKGVFAAPYHGVTIKDPLIARISAYRFHIEDPIPYESSIKVTIEHGGVNDRPGSDYSSVAYWYQTEPHKTFPELLSSEKRLPVEPYLEHKIKNKFSDLKEIGFNAFEKIGELFNL